MQGFTLAATALERRRVANLRFTGFIPEKAPVPILQEAEWATPPFWTRNIEEKSSPLHRLGSNMGRPVRRQAPCS